VTAMESTAHSEVSLVLQYIAVIIAVMVSAWVVLRKQFPSAERRVRIALATPLVREARPAWLRAVGRRIAPTPRVAADGGCGGCNGCETGNDRPA
jgi:hypothetical protein